MKANNLTISIPLRRGGPRCDKNCPYCISLMTPQVEFNYDLFFHNLEKAKYMANTCSVISVLLTSKGEPCLNFHQLVQAAMAFSDFPLELQTNGIWLRNHPTALQELKAIGVDTIAFSIDGLYQVNELMPITKKIRELGMTTRVCFNVTGKIKEIGFRLFIASMIGFYIDQILIRQITIPDNILSTDESINTQKWIQENTNPDIYTGWYNEFMDLVTEKDLVRTLPHGAQVYDIDGFAVSFSDYCIQESNNTEDIRSLIYLEDGHLYTSWDKIPSSRLF